MTQHGFPPDLLAQAAALIAAAAARGLRLATAESCTGGLVAALLTEVPGASSVFECGFVTYSNAAKSAMLGVHPALIDAHGAVSAAVARAMALGAIGHCSADIAVAITGIAGPGGGSAAKPVGLVHFACARRDGTLVAAEVQFGTASRSTIRLLAAEKALAFLAEAIGFGSPV